MSYVLCCRSRPITSGIISHGLQKTDDRFLVEGSDASVLVNYSSLDFGESRAKRPLAGQNVRGVNTICLECHDVFEIKSTDCRAQFVIFLRTTTDAEKRAEVGLREPHSIALFPEPLPYSISNEHFFVQSRLT
ncbi:hypothetical protein D3C79_596510 [compost metagenome]